jgi:hypothetical protein
LHPTPSSGSGRVFKGQEDGITKTFRIGTRGSALALTQSQWVAARIREHVPDAAVELVIIKTKGDIMQDVSLVQIGGKGLFIKEIEEALLKGEVDIAVHSMKDVPAELPDELEIVVTPLREDPRDVLISRNNRKLEEMPRGARIGPARSGADSSFGIGCRTWTSFPSGGTWIRGSRRSNRRISTA